MRTRLLSGNEAVALGAWEAGVAVGCGYPGTPSTEILEALAAKPADSHVILTGRNAPDLLIAAADLVTEMTLVKHPFRDGVKAQPGIEF